MGRQNANYLSLKNKAHELWEWFPRAVSFPSELLV
jgi:hypothetical protein